MESAEQLERHKAVATPRRAPLPSWLYVMNWSLDRPGGVNEVVRNLFDFSVARLHHRPLLLVRSWGQRTPESSIRDGRRTILASWPTPWGSTRPLRHLVSFVARLPRALSQLRRLVHTDDVRTIHVHFPGLDSLVWPLVRATCRERPRLILSFHGLDLKSALAARGIERAAWRRLLRSADHIVVCAEPLRQSLLAGFPDVGPVTCIENGVDVEQIERAALVPPQWRPSAPFIFSAGTYEAKKGLDILVRAFDRIAGDFPDVALVIAGRYEKDQFAVVDAIRLSLGSADRIHLLKSLPHDETMRVLRRASCFVLASREEPFGIALLEAGALEIPAVATSVCGALAHLRADVDVRVVPAEDVAALAEAIAAILNDAVAARRLSANLRTAVRERLNWSQIVPRYGNLGGAPDS